MGNESEPPSGDTNHQYNQEREETEILLLEAQKPSRLEKISSAIIFNRFKECPLLYENCLGKDSTCLGDMNKFHACNIFFEYYLTAPPANHEFK